MGQTESYQPRPPPVLASSPPVSSPPPTFSPSPSLALPPYGPVDYGTWPPPLPPLPRLQTCTDVRDLFSSNGCCDATNPPPSLSEAYEASPPPVGRWQWATQASRIYDSLLAACEDPSFSPPEDTRVHVDTPLGRAFFELHKSTLRTPPTRSDFEAHFSAPGVMNAGDSLLRAEERYVRRLLDATMPRAADLSDKVALITGCSSGMGFAAAVFWAERGGIVHCTGRDRRIFEWHRAIALTDGEDVFVTARASTGNLAEAAVALGLPSTATEEQLAAQYASLGVTDGSANDVNGVKRYLLPQTYYPIYSGPVGVSPEVFDARIHFAEVDARNSTAVAAWVSAVRAAHDTLHYACFNAQTEVGFSYTSPGMDDYFEQMDDDMGMSDEAFLRQYPTRAHGIRHASIHKEVYVGVSYLLSRLVREFGEASLKEHTMMHFLSSIAATQARHFAVQDATFGGPHYGWFEYRNAKQYLENMAEMLKRYGYRAQTLSPAVFNTFINLGWVYRYTGRTDLPPAYTLAPANDGKFYYPLTATGLHDLQAGLLRTTYVGGAGYGAAQYLALWHMGRTAPSLTDLKHMHLSNPPQEAASWIGGRIADFGPAWSDVEARAECLDYGRREHNTGWLSRYKVSNAFAPFAEWSADVALDAIWKATAS